MSYNTGFAPVSRKDAQILILGSMPSERSLKEQQYYAHPRNAFWPIICQLLNASNDLNYIKRTQLLIKNQIALWDVLKSCYREGSLDSNIDHSTIQPNNFYTFFIKHKKIKNIFFNGGEAEKLYRKYVFKELNEFGLEYHRLPSTSPAHAAMSFEQKYNEWKLILKLK